MGRAVLKRCRRNWTYTGGRDQLDRYIDWCRYCGTLRRVRLGCVRPEDYAAPTNRRRDE